MGNTEIWNRWMDYPDCTRMPIRKSELPTAAVSQLMFQQVSIKDPCNYHCYGSSIMWIQNWMPLGVITCRWPYHGSWITWQVENEIKELEGLEKMGEMLGRQRSCALDTMLPIPRSHLLNSYVEYARKVLEQSQSLV